MSAYKTNSVNSAIIGTYILLLTIFIISFLYFGKKILIPTSIAVLLTFLLAPIVSRLERFIGRIASVFVTVVLFFILISIIGYVLSLELIDLTSKLPNYKNNIQAKFHSISILKQSITFQILETIQYVENYFPWIHVGKTTNMVTKKLELNIEMPNITQAAQILLKSMLDVLSKVGLIMALVIFMLLGREDLKARIIKLIGPARIGLTTKAMNDAGYRFSHYLMTQLIINFSFGIILSIGLYFIGIPNAALWGALLVILRFIPYIGFWIAAAIPIALSFIISSSWLIPIYTIAIYLILDLLISNVFEPLLYGTITGVSSNALIVAVVFWTVLWGPVGLLIAVPLTVCLVVIGRHVPRFKFLSILLSDDKNYVKNYSQNFQKQK